MSNVSRLQNTSSWDSVKFKDKTIDELCARLQMKQNKMKTMEKGVMAFKTEVQNKNKSGVKCFSCGEIGHIKSQCSKKRCVI